MIEKKLQKRLKKAVILVACICVLFLICGGAFSAYLKDAKNQLLREQGILEAEEYKSRILKQLQADFQTLSSLSIFLGSDYSLDQDLLAERLSQTQKYNNFVTIAYYDQDLKGVISNKDKNTLTRAGLSELSAEGQEGIKKAMSGESSVSKLFKSTISNSYVFVYSVPVFEGNEITGALSASSHIEIFSDILSGNTVLGGGGYIHLINSDGDFLIRSSNTVVKEDVPSIFEGPYLSESSKAEVQEALQDQERIFSSFTYNGQTYPFLLEPVGLNNWYLFCVNTGGGLNSGSVLSIRVVQILFAAIVLLIVFLMLYGYRLLRNYNQALLQLAYYDTLTGAENMSRFRQRLADALKSTRGCIIAFSIRQFPFLTEIFGKEKSDQLLCQIKEIAERHIETGEFFCRDAEDRFYLFYKETDTGIIRRRLENLIKEIETNSLFRRTDYQLAIYCGVTISSVGSDPQEEAESMLTRIHFALDKAKGGHSSTIWFFDTELHKQEELENYIESHMHGALQNGEFKLFLQPKTDLKSGSLCGAEALVRWQSNNGRMIFPNQFIPLFETNGFCTNLDLYMAEQACRQIRYWMDNGIDPVPISVNQSKLLFFEGDYVQKMTDLLKKYRIPAQFITLEILEGMALDNVDELNAKIIQLQNEGFRISLDDFGSGYSSLNILGNLKIDEVKLDRDFLISAADQKQNRVRLIMEEIVRLAGRLGISTLAEGVETPEDEQLIRTIGCDTGQGYLYSRPLSISDFNKKYMEHRLQKV
ncbi:MAG TPA: EAL domain-containing protein [Candidatus Blautia excrementipullorum]|nr:EAL domain-containing protein [Candidatus Blautia excrementipullorum]